MSAWKRISRLVDERPLASGLLLGMLHALLFGLSYPPFGLWPLSFIALVPLLAVGCTTRSPVKAAAGASLASMPMWLVHHWWIGEISAAGLLPLVLYLSLWPGVFVWCIGRVHTSMPRLPIALTGPILWVGLEVVRGQIIWDGYPWFLLGHPLVDAPLLPLIASLLGVYGVSLLGAMINGVICDLVLRLAGKQDRSILVLGTACVTSLAIGAGLPWVARQQPALQATNAGTIRVGIVQTNVPQSNKTFSTIDEQVAQTRTLIELSERCAALAPDLIAWPETSVYGLGLNREAVDAARAYSFEEIPLGVFHDMAIACQQSIGIPIVAGALATDGLRIDLNQSDEPIRFDARYNSAFVLQDGSVLETRYDKVHLTPFGEVMPGISSIDWLERLLLALGASGMSFDLSAGDMPQALEVALPAGSLVTVATPICFEVTMSNVCRDLVFAGGRRRADLLLNLTNDGWFGASEGGRLRHLQAARWRCLELATPMVRAANTGISVGIDRFGNLIESTAADRAAITSLPMNEAGVLVVPVSLPSEASTLFARIGNLVGWLCLAGVGMLLAGSVICRRSGLREAEDDTAPADEMKDGVEMAGTQ